MILHKALKVFLWIFSTILGIVSVACTAVTFWFADNKMTFALILVITAIIIVMGVVIAFCFFVEVKGISMNGIDGEFRHHQLRAAHMTFRQQSAPIILRPPIPRLVIGDCSHPQVHGPPSYEESADLENNRIQSFSNAPPAYNYLDIETSNNIASFSPPPFYRPATPIHPSETSMQSVSLFLSPEEPSTSRTFYDNTPTRVQSPLPRRKLRRTRPHIYPAVSYNISSRVQDRNQIDLTSQTSSTITNVSVPGPSSPECTTSTSSVTHMIIDCSKAEPTMFTINRDESII